MSRFIEGQAEAYRKAGDWRLGPALAALVEAYGCLRFQHMQRSILVERTDAYFKGEAYKGKAHVAGARPKFRWTCPAQGITGIPIA
eukprot:16431427-Heterocapsa_arctica.AAC.1